MPLLPGLAMTTAIRIPFRRFNFGVARGTEAMIVHSNSCRSRIILKTWILIEGLS